MYRCSHPLLLLRLCSTAALCIVRQRGGNDCSLLFAAFAAAAAARVRPLPYFRAGPTARPRFAPAPPPPSSTRAGSNRRRAGERAFFVIGVVAWLILQKRFWREEEHDVSLKPAFRHEARAHVNWNIAEEEEKTLCCITIDEKRETTMVQSEDEVLKAAQAILEQKQYQKLRNYIYVSAVRETFRERSTMRDARGAIAGGGGRTLQCTCPEIQTGSASPASKQSHVPKV